MMIPLDATWRFAPSKPRQPRAETGAARRLPREVYGKLGRPFDRHERTGAERRLRGNAAALIDKLPGVALIVGLGGRGASGAGASRAIVLALERNAVALLLGASLCRRCGHGRQ